MEPQQRQYYCYGRFYLKRFQCRKCELRKYCRDAQDPPLLSERFNEKQHEQIIDSQPEERTRNRLAEAEKKKLYTRADLLEVIAFMATLDPNSRSLIAKMLGDPLFNIEDYAKEEGVSARAIYYRIQCRMQRHPQLSEFLGHYFKQWGWGITKRGRNRNGGGKKDERPENGS